jgi:hypothetical protein
MERRDTRLSDLDDGVVAQGDRQPADQEGNEEQNGS